MANYKRKEITSVWPDEQQELNYIDSGLDSEL